MSLPKHFLVAGKGRAPDCLLEGQEFGAAMLAAERCLSAGDAREKIRDRFADQAARAVTEKILDLVSEGGDDLGGGDAGLLAQLADGRLEVSLSLLEVALWKAPVTPMIEQKILR